MDGQTDGAASGARVLVVEDDEAIRSALRTAYADAGYDVTAVEDGAGFEDRIDAIRPDLAVLDVMLPGRDGFALARVLRGRSDAAILFLTARGDLDDRLEGFASGADDYVPKPFAVSEVLARSAAALRRLGRLPHVLAIGDLRLDLDGQVASRGDQRLDLTGTEWRLLVHLVENRGRTLSKTQILTQVWGYDDYDPNLVEVHVSALRRKTEAAGDRVIHTVRGLGYVMRA